MTCAVAIVSSPNFELNRRAITELGLKKIFIFHCA